MLLAWLECLTNTRNRHKIICYIIKYIINLNSGLRNFHVFAGTPRDGTLSVKITRRLKQRKIIARLDDVNIKVSSRSSYKTVILSCDISRVSTIDYAVRSFELLLLQRIYIEIRAGPTYCSSLFVTAIATIILRECHPPALQKLPLLSP